MPPTLLLVFCKSSLAFGSGIIRQNSKWQVGTTNIKRLTVQVSN